jgi:hypothetical protein
MSIDQLWNAIQTRIIESPRTSPSVLTIPRDHVDKNTDGSLDFAFRSDTHYFQVIINEMYLRRDRRWLTDIEPVVYVVSEFTYNLKAHISPFLVGPTLLKSRGIPDNVADGTILRNTSVAGPYPYRGKGLTLTVVLCESKSDNVLRPLLRVVENTAEALGFSPLLAPYTKVANVLMSGFDALFNAGGVSPLVGLRDSYGPNFGTKFMPSYFALIDKENVSPDTLWVRENQLMHGSSLKSSKPYRDADFVLYSVGCPDDNVRDDMDELPFEALWQRVQKEAATPVDDPDYKNARTLMSALYQEIVLSPDLTEAQADALADTYFDRMSKIHERAKRVGLLSPADAADEAQRRLARARERALAIANG